MFTVTVILCVIVATKITILKLIDFWVNLCGRFFVWFVEITRKNGNKLTSVVEIECPADKENHMSQTLPHSLVKETFYSERLLQCNMHASVRSAIQHHRTIFTCVKGNEAEKKMCVCLRVLGKACTYK